MLTTSIRHGDLVLDFDGAGWVQITRQSNAQSIQLSQSEWIFCLKCAELRGWPMAPPGSTVQEANLGGGIFQPGVPSG